MPIWVLVYVKATPKIIQIQENQVASTACQFLIGKKGLIEPGSVVCWKMSMMRSTLCPWQIDFTYIGGEIELAPPPPTKFSCILASFLICLMPHSLLISDKAKLSQIWHTRFPEAYDTQIIIRDLLGSTNSYPTRPSALKSMVVKLLQLWVP